jgi:hypothetical protein
VHPVRLVERRSSASETLLRLASWAHAGNPSSPPHEMAVVVRKAKCLDVVVLLPRHPGDDIAYPTPGVAASVQEPQFGLARSEGEEAEGGAERGGAAAHPRFPSIHWRASCSTRRLASFQSS